MTCNKKIARFIFVFFSYDLIAHASHIFYNEHTHTQIRFLIRDDDEDEEEEEDKRKKRGPIFQFS